MCVKGESVSFVLSRRLEVKVSVVKIRFFVW